MPIIYIRVNGPGDKIRSINIKGGGGGGGGGVQAFYFGKTDFELGVEGEGQDTSRHFYIDSKSFRQIHRKM